MSAQSQETGQSAAAGNGAEDKAFSEYEVKAGFIYRFISFVSWPGEQADGSVITIGILGKNPFGNAFASIEGSKVGNRVVRIKYFAADSDYSELKSCQILYVAASLEKRLPDVFKALGDRPTLTIGDSKGFIDHGGMIGFVKRDQARLGIEINEVAAGKARLAIRSMLKRMAVRMIRDPGVAGGH